MKSSVVRKSEFILTFLYLYLHLFTGYFVRACAITTMSQ